MPSTNIILATLFDGNLKVKSTNVDASIPDLVSDISGLQDDNLLKIDLQYPPVSLGTGNTISGSSSKRYFPRTEFQDFWDWCSPQWNVYDEFNSGSQLLTFETDYYTTGATETFTGIHFIKYTNHGTYGDCIYAYNHSGLNGFLPSGGGATVTITGVPSVGTATVEGLIPGVDMTGIATGNYLTTGVDSIKASTPTAFDTLGEIANALPTSGNVSAYISLNTGSRLHTLIGDGTTTEFSVTHNSGNIDVFVDGVLRVPQLSDSASGTTTVLSSYDYYSSDGTQGTTWTWSAYVGTNTVQFGYDSSDNKWEWWPGWGSAAGSYAGWNSTNTWGIYRDPTVHPDSITDYGDMAQDWLFTAGPYNSGTWNGTQTRQGSVSNVQGRAMTASTIAMMMPVDPIHYLLSNPSGTTGGPMISQDASGQSSSHVVFTQAPEVDQVITVKTY